MNILSQGNDDAVDSGLGQFSKLPPELREIIWLEFLPVNDTDTRSPANMRPKCNLQVLQVSRQLRDEIEDVVYRRTTLQFNLSSKFEGPEQWDQPWTTVSFKNGFRRKQVQTEWILKGDAVVVDNWFDGFPFHKIHSVEINLLATGLTLDLQPRLFWLWRNIIRTVRLLNMAKFIPSLKIKLQNCEDQNSENNGDDAL